MLDNARLRSLLKAIAGESQIQSEVNMTSFSRESAGEERQKSPGSQSPRFFQQEENLQEEIKRLRTLLSDALLKEMNLLCEKHRQEGQISELRSMIEKYQRDLLLANSQLTLIQSDALEERTRLIAERKAAQQDVDVYAASLLPLLSEYNLQPASKDPHSISSGIKALVQHLQTERRYLAAPQYRILDTPPIHEDPTENIFTPPPIHEDPTFPVPDENDYLPGIKDLYIDGNAVIGNTICAYGFPINGTSLCHFQWVRHYSDGAIYIPGAARPQYTITADDVDTCISLLCTPMDIRQRKGQTIEVFANNNDLITLGRDLEEQISKYLNSGEALFRVEMQDSNEVFSVSAILIIKKFMYEIKNMITKECLAMGRYDLESNQVEVKIGDDRQLSIINGGAHVLKCENNRARDVVVLTMRGFIATIVDADRGKPQFKGRFVSAS